MIPNLRDGVLQVNGVTAGDLNDGMQFLQQSPLKATIGKALQGFVFSGPMNLVLQLIIPFKDDNTKVQGNLTIKNTIYKFLIGGICT